MHKTHQWVLCTLLGNRRGDYWYLQNTPLVCALLGTLTESARMHTCGLCLLRNHHRVCSYAQCSFAPNSLAFFCPAAAAQADAVATLLTCCTAAVDNPDITSRSLHVLRRLLAVDSSKAAFMRADGASTLAALLTKQSSKPSGSCALHT